MIRIAAILLFACPFVAAEELVILTSKAFSIRCGEIELVWAGKPIEVKTITITDFSKPAEVMADGKYNVFFTPKGGLKVNVQAEWSPKAGKNAIQLADHLGTAVVFGDNLPRVESIVLTDETDPGPGEKGHRPIQKTADFKDDLIVPAGFYSVWIVPSNGAKAQRVAERIRVLAGRETRVGE